MAKFRGKIHKDHQDDSIFEKYKALDHAIAKFAGSIICTGRDNENVDYLQFETEEDFIYFKMYWILNGS